MFCACLQKLLRRYGYAILLGYDTKYKDLEFFCFEWVGALAYLALEFLLSSLYSRIGPKRVLIF